jgi:putative toxin-antitoxin system antitoxin component (TIGR02293 family)
MGEVERIVDLLGGASTLGAEVLNEQDLVGLVRAGLPYDAVEALLKTKRMTPSEIYRVLNRHMLARRRSSRTRLKPEDSDRLERVARMIAQSEEIFANPDKAYAWLREPNAALKDERPIDLLDTGAGARRVEVILTRIAYGVYS